MDKYVRADEAKSGQLAGREGLDELVELAQQSPRPFDGILTDDTSRFGRNLSNTLPMIDKLTYAGVFLYFVNRGLDSRDPNFRTLYLSYGHTDEQFSKSVGEKVHRGQRGRVEKGLLASGRVYGYDNVPIIDQSRKGPHGQPWVEGVELKPNSEAAVVVRIFEMYARGAGCKVIARTLNKEGVPSPLHGQSPIKRVWHANTIRRMLQNEKYRGLNVWNKTKVVINPTKQRKEQQPRPESEWERKEVPAWQIVPDELWNAAAKIIKGRQGSTKWKDGGLNRSEASRKYIFSGIIECADCGHTVNVISGKGKRVRYGCSGHRARGDCENKFTILQTTLEGHLLPALSQKIENPATREKLYLDFQSLQEATMRERELTVSKVASCAEELQGRWDELKSQAKNLLDVLSRTNGSQLVIERLNSIEAELADIDEQLSTQTEVSIEPLSADAIYSLLDEKLAEVKLAIAAEPEVAKQLLRKYIPKLMLTPRDTPEGPMYEVTGDIMVFGDAGGQEGVVLTASLKRSSKFYTSLSIPFQTAFYTKAPAKKTCGKRSKAL